MSETKDDDIRTLMDRIDNHGPEPREMSKREIAYTMALVDVCAATGDFERSPALRV